MIITRIKVNVSYYRNKNYNYKNISNIIIYPIIELKAKIMITARM